VKARRRRWDPPKLSKVVPESAELRSEIQSEHGGHEVSDSHSFRDPRARSDLSFSGCERQDSERPAAGTSDSPTPDERLACTALAELAQGVPQCTLAQKGDNPRWVHTPSVSALNIFVDIFLPESRRWMDNGVRTGAFFDSLCLVLT
jgi:hypothetical protein